MKNAFIFLLLLIGFKANSQTTAAMSFTNPTYDAGTGKFRASLTIASTSGNNTWELGNMNLRFNYPTNTLSSPVIAVNHLVGSGFSYGNPTTTGSNLTTGVMSYNITLPSATPGKPIPSAGFSILTIEWNVTSVPGLSNPSNKLEWRIGTSFPNPRLAMTTSTLTAGCPAGCAITAVGTVLSPLIVASTPLSVLINKVNQTNCATPNGSATAVASNGTTPYGYLWSNGATTSTISNLTAGNYSVTVTDNAAATATASTTIGGPATVSGSISAQTNVSCFGGSNGSVTVAGSGGTAPYSIVPAQTGLAAGSYTFTVTDANGCQGTVSGTITEPTALSATITTQNNVTCFGVPNGSVVINATGGTAPYTIVPAQTGLSAGMYQFTVTDANGCTQLVSTTITSPSQLSASIGSISHVTCNGGSNGSVVVNASGGIAPYLITPAQTGLTAGSYTFTVTDANGCFTTVSATINQASAVMASITAQTDANCGQPVGSVTIGVSGGTGPYTIAPAQTGLASGQYQFTVTDSNGCTAMVNAVINSTSGLSAFATGIDASCFGAANGSVNLNISGGTLPYTVAPATTGLVAGTYTFTITDNAGCTVTASTTIGQPSAVSGTIANQTQVSCFGGSNGSVVINTTGGTAPYTIVPAQTGLSAGTYIFTITDFAGCTGTVSATIGQPTAVSGTIASQTEVSCFGGTNGSVVINATGGTSPYTIVPAQTGLSAGTYTFTITDFSGCTGTVSATISEPAQLSASIGTTTNVTCNGGSDGAAALNISGGTGNYTIAPATQGLTAGSYNFTVTDANGCTTVVSATITQPAALLASINSQTDASCGQANGSVSIAVTGGTGNYTIVPAQTGLSAGSYQFTITDSNGCITTLNVVINSTSGLAATATGVDATCFGASNGSVNLNISGGTMPYTVAPATTGLAAGTYTFTITDNTGCTITATATVGQPTAVTGTIANQTAVTCFGGSNGSVVINATGGTAPYTIAPAQTGLAVGTYTFTITDFSGCTGTVSATITGATQVVSTVTSQVNVSCNGGSNGSVSLSTSGGTAPYSVVPSTTGLAAGAYVFTVTDASGCSTTVQVTITEPSAISATIASQTAVNCAGGSNGSVTLSISGGTAPYSILNTAGILVGNTISGLAAGGYTFVITDSNGCSTSVSATITSNNIVINANAGPDVTINCITPGTTLTATGGVSYLWSTGAATAAITVSPALTTTYNVTVTGSTGCTGTDAVVVTVDKTISANAGPDVSLNCTNPSATLTATGGATYVWNTTETVATINVSPTVTTTYTVTVTGANGCTASDAVVVSADFATPNGSAGANGLINCNISSATLTGSGGVSYLWSNGLTTASFTASPTVTTFYTVTVTGANTCTTSAIASIVVDKTPPNANAGADVVVNSTNPSATLVATGGVSYVWSNGATTAATTVTPLQTTSYTVTVTGANGCKSTDMVLVTVERKVNLAFGNPQIIGNKFRFTIRLSAADPFGIGSTNFRFNYNQNALSNLTVISDVFPGPDFSATTLTGTSQTTGIASVNTAYSGAANLGLITITSFPTDVVTLEFTITNPLSTSNLVWRTTTTPRTAVVDDDKVSSVTIDQINNLNFPLSTVSISSLTSTNNLCFGETNGSAQVTAIGGLLPYSYAWSNGATTSSISNLAAGVYTVSVTDALPVTVSQSVTITEPSQLTATFTQTNVSCNGANNGSVVITPAGGTAPYTIAPSQTGLTPGVHNFTVTDANNCTTIISATITEPTALALSVTPNAVRCHGGSTGSLDVVVSGGTGITEYYILPFHKDSIKNVSASGPNGCGSFCASCPGVCLGFGRICMCIHWGSGTNPSSQARTNLPAGDYTVVAIDANDCITYTGATITQPAPLLVTTIPTPVTCHGNSTGSIDISSTGGTGTVEYLILATHPDSVKSAAAGANCSSFCSNCPTPNICFGTSRFCVCISWGSGTNPSALARTNLPAGNYTVFAVDANDCVTYQGVTITQPATPLSATFTQQNVTCFGGNDGSVTLNVTGGTSPYTIAPAQTALTAGSYTFTITDANGCSITQSATILDGFQNTVDAGADVTLNCTNPSAVLTATGGSGTYLWSNGETSASITVDPTSTTTYSVTITSANGCTATDAVVVTVDKTAPNASAGADATINCTTLNAVLTASGGGTYLWSNGATTASITVEPTTTTTYSVTVSTSNGCTATDDVVVTVDNGTPQADAGFDATINCTNSSATLTASGGASYAWSNGETTSSITVSPTAMTTYRVTVTGANGCQATDEAVVFINKTAPIANAGLDVTITYGSSANLNASGGVSYAWSNGATTAATTVSPNDRTTYTVTVTAANGCTATDAVVVSVEKKYSLSFVNASVVGNKFRFTIRMSTATPFCIGSNNLRFNFNKTALNNLVVISDAFPTPAFGATTIVGTSYTSGIASLNTAYVGAASACLVPITAAGTDLMTCEFDIINPSQTSQFVWRNTSNPVSSVVADDKFTVCVPDQLIGLNVAFTPLSISGISKQDVLCAGSATGSATVNAVGGLTPYTYIWSNAATTQTINNLAAGTYSVTVTDAFGTTATSSVTLTQPASSIFLSTQVTNASCFGANGMVDLSVVGGTAPFSYAWSNSATTEDISASAGTYSVTVTDANGCTVATGATITEPALFSTNAGADVTINCINPTTILNAVGGVSFAWDNSAAQGDEVSPATTTTYTVTATDANGCTATDQMTVTVDKTAPIANAGPDQTLNCSTSYTLTATGGGTYLWSTGETTATIVVDPTSATAYSVTVSFANGCTSTDDVAFIDDTAPVFAASFPADMTINCQDSGTIPGLDDVVIDIVNDCNVFVSGEETSTQTSTGCGAYSYVLTRTWTAIDASGNAATKTQTITVKDDTAPMFTSAVPVSGGIYSNENTPRPPVMTASDNCSSVTVVLDSVVVKNPLTGCQSYNNTVTRTWTASDACGNSTQVSQTFTSVGAILLTCPADKTLNTNSDGTNNYNCSTLVLASDNLKPNFADVCDISNVLRFNVGGATINNGNGTISGTLLNRGVNIVTYTVTGVTQTQTCTFNVTVVDNELPKFNTPPTVVLDVCAFPASIPTNFNPVATDNCSVPTLTVVSDVTADLSGSCATKVATAKYTKSMTRTWRATDASGNSTTVVQNIFLRDMIAPTAVCKTGIIIPICKTNVVVPASTFNNGSSDNCTPASMLSFAACRNSGCTNFASSLTFSPSLIPVGVTQVNVVVSMRVMDACGNTSVCNVNVTLRRITCLENDSNVGNNLAGTIDNEKNADKSTTPSDVITEHGAMKCFPNPFSDDLNIQYNLTNDENQVILKVYDNQGKVVRTMDQSTQYKGYYSVRWNLSDLEAGMYHVCLELGGKCTKVERVVLLK
ncbi:MAG: T9SS type A sorting domain-containing protein [Saprospiraceae bacterium]